MNEAIVRRWFFAVLLAGLVVAGGAWLVTAQPRPAGAPEITGGPWINSDPLTLSSLRGRVVLVEFWTYG